MPDVTFPHGTLLQQFAAKFPLPNTPGGGEEHENKCRAWCLKFAEQVHFSTGDAGWGVKSAGANRPQSKDAIARQQGASLVAWDLMSGAGTGAPSLAVNPEFHDIAGQQFIPVAAVDHLGPTPVETHGYDGGANDTGQCDVVLRNGQRCGQPRNAAIHKASDPEPRPDDIAEMLRRIMADVAAIRAHFR